MSVVIKEEVQRTDTERFIAIFLDLSNFAQNLVVDGWLSVNQRGEVKNHTLREIIMIFQNFPNF